MHKQVWDWLLNLKRTEPDVFAATTVLEAGSLNINGSVRPLFEQATDYVGVDWRGGPGVDVVSLIHEYADRPDGYFDTVISTQMLEHDPYGGLSLLRMSRLLKPGGALVLTWAGPEWVAHEIDAAPVKGYYRGQSLTPVLVYIGNLGEFTRRIHKEFPNPNDCCYCGIGWRPDDV